MDLNKNLLRLFYIDTSVRTTRNKKSKRPKSTPPIPHAGRTTFWVEIKLYRRLEMVGDVIRHFQQDFEVLCASQGAKALHG